MTFLLNHRYHYRFQHSNLYDHVLKMPNVVFGVDGNFLWQFLQNHFQPHEITNMCVFKEKET